MVGSGDGAGNFQLSGRPTEINNSRARANCTSVGADGVVWAFFLSPIISNFFFPLSGRRPDIN